MYPTYFIKSIYVKKAYLRCYFYAKLKSTSDKKACKKIYKGPEIRREHHFKNGILVLI